MFQKFTIIQLLIALGVLSILYISALAINSGSNQTFKKNLSIVETSSVQSININVPGKDPVKLKKLADKWMVTLANGTDAPAAASSITNAIESVANLEALQLVSTKANQWNSYKVDTSGTQIQLFGANNQTLLDIVAGRFEYKQTGMMSYVRPTEGNEVYLVPGFFDLTFNKATEDWRDKKLIKTAQANWFGISFNYPADTSFQIAKGTDNQWRLPDSTQLDFSKVSAYLSALSNLSGNTFVSAPSNTTPAMEIQIATADGGIQLRAFDAGDGSYVVSSSENQGAYFAGSDNNLFSNAFVGLGNFLSTETISP